MEVDGMISLKKDKCLFIPVAAICNDCLGTKNQQGSEDDDNYWLRYSMSVFYRNNMW